MPGVLSLLTGLSTAVIQKLVSCELHLVLESDDKALLEERFINTDSLCKI